MKKAIWIFALGILLAGKGTGLLPEGRGLEEWKLVTALALDEREGQVTATALTGVRTTEEERPEVFTGQGSSLAQACDALRESSSRRAYLGQTQQILLGEGRGLKELLDYVLTDRELRTDTLLYIVRGAAGEALGASADKTGSETGGSDPRGRTLGELLPRLSEGEPVLVPALAPDEEGTLTPAGWAVVEPGGVAGYLEGDAALGAGLLARLGTDRVVTLPGGAVELGSFRFWVREGTLFCRLASRTVQGNPGPEELEAWGKRVVGAALAPGWDCWGLRRQEAALSPGRWDSWQEAGGGVETLNIQVEGRLSHGGKQ